jgi:glutamate decarboxylase
LIPYIKAADDDAEAKRAGHGLSIPGGGPRTALVEHHNPQKIEQLLNLNLPNTGQGKCGLLEIVQGILQYSVNTWDQGFLDKLYASTDAVGVVSELILAVLNTNVHVYQVSPSLTIVEKTTCKALANMFGMVGAHAGGISVQGGSASNTTAIVVARNTLYPDTKIYGNFASGRKLIIFTGAHGHYSIEKAAQMLGFGSASVKSVSVDSEGRMMSSDLSSQVEKAKTDGYTPFFVNATAGTTVLGSYDPFGEIAAVCKRQNMWLHIDASWGGPAIFSPTHAFRLAGSELADSISVNPHKMMGVPITCSFLLGADMRRFHKANTLPASYLFHNEHPENENTEVYDLADLTLQCGRRGDALKIALGWIYYGKEGYAMQIDNAFAMAAYMARRVSEHSDLKLVSSNPPPCLQVCFYYAPKKELHPEAEWNSKTTANIATRLIRKGFMIDYAPGDKGKFFRVVINRRTTIETIDGLLRAISEAGRQILERVQT